MSGHLPYNPLYCAYSISLKKHFAPSVFVLEHSSTPFLSFCYLDQVLFLKMCSKMFTETLMKPGLWSTYNEKVCKMYAYEQSQQNEMSLFFLKCN